MLDAEPPIGSSDSEITGAASSSVGQIQPVENPV
jgi:hypothetical protein